MDDKGIEMTIHRVLPDQAARVRADLGNLARDVRSSFVELGDSGDEVRAVQRLLANTGYYSGPVDGRFHASTDEAVRRFQAANHIVVDGAVGPQTLGKLRQSHLFVANDRFTTPAARGQSGEDIRAVEAKLREAGLNPGKVDGVFDRRTEEAVRRFRASSPSLPDRPKTIDAALTRELNQRLQSAHQTPPRPASEPRPGTPEYFSKHAPVNDYHHVRFGEVTVNARTADMLHRAETIMRQKYGHRGFHFDLSQGSYNHGGVAASAGTHDGGGAADIRTAGRSRALVDDMVRSLREAGFAAWSRGRGHDTFAPHIHAIAIGDRQLSAQAASQVAAYARGRNGLRDDARDPDRNLGRHTPEWARRFL